MVKLVSRLNVGVGSDGECIIVQESPEWPLSAGISTSVPHLQWFQRSFQHKRVKVDEQASVM